MKKVLFVRFYVLLMLSLLTAGVGHAHSFPYKIALIHSFEPGYSTGERAREMLGEELFILGLDCEFREYFLDCDFYGESEENQRMNDFLDNISDWDAHLIAVLDDQATYALMACGHRLAKEIPVVFSGVNYPNEGLLGSFPNVTGYADIPDYLRTIRMVERIMGKGRVCLINGSTYLDRKIWNHLSEQCGGEGFSFTPFVGDEKRLREIIDPSKSWKKQRSVLDSTTIVRLTSDSLSIKDMTWMGNGSHINSVFLYTKCDYTTNRIATLFYNPTFETVNEGFGVKDYMLGGYFTPLEVQLQYMAEGIKERLDKKMPRQLTYCPKQYVVNWHVLQRYNIPLEVIPEEYTVMYIPFYVVYRTPFIYGALILSVVLLAIITTLSYGFFRERRRKREALRDKRYEHETLRLAIEGGSTYVWRLEEDRVYCDSQFYELIGQRSNRLQMEEIFTFIHPDDLPSFKEAFAMIKTRLRHKGQYRCRFNGEYQWWEFSYNTIQSEENAPIVTGLLRNIQEVKDHEAELIEARQLAEKAEMKQSFLNNMSHEIRTPLNAIAGFSSMLVNDPELPEDEKREFADLIDTNTQLLLKLMDSVLELSGIESGYLSFQEEEESVRSLLDRVCGDYRRLFPASLEFIQDFPAEDVLVRVDAMRLVQVVTNLLDNAVKFTAAGYIKVGYRFLPDAHEVHIFVEDTGMGIPHNIQNLIFDRFYKHDEFSQGVGLGLCICQLIVEKMQGRISLESEEGKGSRFTVILPAVKP